MKKTKMYRYLGRNGILTTKIHLDGISYIPMVLLQADEGKILTDGERKHYSITVEETEAELCREITDNTDK